MRYYIPLLIVMIGAIVTLGCSDSKQHWTEIEPTGLPKPGDFFSLDLYMQHGGKGLWVGYSLNGPKSIVQLAVALLTTDGGQSWQKFDLGEGEASICIKSDQVLAVVVINRAQQYSTIYEYHAGEGFLKTLRCERQIMKGWWQNDMIILYTQDWANKNTDVRKSTDLGKSWTELSELGSEVLDAALVKQKLYYIAAKSNLQEGATESATTSERTSVLVGTRIECVDIVSLDRKRSVLPQSLRVDVLASDSSQLLLVGREFNLISMYSIDTTMLLTSRGVLPQHGDALPVFGGCRGELMHVIMITSGGMLGALHSAVYSTDFGVTWLEGSLPDRLVIPPVFYDPQPFGLRLLINSGVGGINILELTG